MSGAFLSCEVCGSGRSRLFLRSARLDGPLVRCPDCGYLFIGRRIHDFTFQASDSALTEALAAQVGALAIVNRDVEEGEAADVRRQAQQERVDRLCAQILPGGRLLDVGCGSGTFLEVASERFDAEGVEPDPATSSQARARGLAVSTGALDQVRRPPGGYDAITMYHLIEHLDSPRAGLTLARELIAERGVLMIETPRVDSAFFLLAPARWRQLIPDHYHFFSRVTLSRLLADTGFAPTGYVKVGRRVSWRFAADRWRRAGLPAAGAVSAVIDAAGLSSRTVRLVPGDIMEIAARPV